jgi:hypothetical protein
MASPSMTLHDSSARAVPLSYETRGEPSAPFAKRLGASAGLAAQPCAGAGLITYHTASGGVKLSTLIEKAKLPHFPRKSRNKRPNFDAAYADVVRSRERDLQSLKKAAEAI